VGIGRDGDAGVVEVGPVPGLGTVPARAGRAGDDAAEPQRPAGISVAELAGKPSHLIQLGGQWWASWQTSRSGEEKIASQQVEIKQEGELLQVATITRGLTEEEGGFHWSGELRLWDNEILMGWYAANEGSIRSKGTM